MKMAKVLIVDDSPLTRHLLGSAVEMAGHEVVAVAEDGKQAVKLFESIRPDLVTLDWLMPRKSGEAVLHKIMMIDPQAKVIMVTGWANNVIEERVLKAGAKAFVEKSKVESDLLDVIERVLAETD